METAINQAITSEKQFSSSQFLKITNVLKKIEMLNNHLYDEEEHKQNSSEFDFLWNQAVQP